MSERDYADLLREAAKTIRRLHDESEIMAKVLRNSVKERKRLQAENEGLRAEINRLLGTNG